MNPQVYKVVSVVSDFSDSATDEVSNPNEASQRIGQQNSGQASRDSEKKNIETKPPRAAKR